MNFSSPFRFFLFHFWFLCVFLFFIAFCRPPLFALFGLWRISIWISNPSHHRRVSPFSPSEYNFFYSFYRCCCWCCRRTTHTAERVVVARGRELKFKNHTQQWSRQISRHRKRNSRVFSLVTSLNQQQQKGKLVFWIWEFSLSRTRAQKRLKCCRKPLLRDCKEFIKVFQRVHFLFWLRAQLCRCHEIVSSSQTFPRNFTLFYAFYSMFNIIIINCRL